MKTMSDYTLYCTEEQTNRAIKLGCPCESPEDYSPIKLPTTQQMINWLREYHHINLRNVIDGGDTMYLEIWQYDKLIISIRKYPRLAILAAIDAALDYLEKGEIK